MTDIEPAAGTSTETLKDRVAYAGFAAAEKLAMALPEDWGRKLFDLGAEAAFHLAPRARRVVEGNLSRVIGRRPGSPALRAATREAFRSYGRYWYETFRIRVMPEDEFQRRMRFEGWENFAGALEAGTGAVLALPHLGNWDAAAKWVHLKGWRITAVAEMLRPERLFRLFLNHRQELGMNIVPLYDDRKVGEELVRLLGQSHLVCLVSDRDLKGRGVIVEMFGEERRLPAGPALLSLATGAPLLPAALYDTDDGWVVFIGEPLVTERTGVLRDDVTALTRLLAAQFERSIAAAPTQWHMFQPAWGPVEGRPAVDAAASP
jgi:KDO2-lipid IV(A) lauroyltransferase